MGAKKSSIAAPYPESKAAEASSGEGHTGKHQKRQEQPDGDKKNGDAIVAKASAPHFE